MRERTVAMPLPERCRRPGCNRAATTRGLCGSDYWAAYDLVRNNKTTWDQLRREGKIAEPRRTAKEWFLGKVSA
jgi:hypothetical protein